MTGITIDLEHTDQIHYPNQGDRYLHRISARKNEWHDVCVMAFDHRWQFHEIAVHAKGHDRDVLLLKKLIFKGAQKTAKRCSLHHEGESQPGILCDDIYGEETLNEATGTGWWIGRPVELPRSRPLEFEYGNNVGQKLTTWPAEHVVKCLVFYHPDDPVELRILQERRVKDLYDACCFSGHELLLEVIPPSNSKVDETTLPRSMSRFYNLSVYPDWWKLPSQPAGYWPHIDKVIDRYDPHCRGIVILGLEQPVPQLAQGFKDSCCSKWVKGFAIGRTIFGEPAKRWLSGNLTDEQLIDQISDRYQEMVTLWQQRRQGGK